MIFDLPVMFSIRSYTFHSRIYPGKCFLVAFRVPVYFLYPGSLILHVRIEKKFPIQRNLLAFACMLCMKFPRCVIRIAVPEKFQHLYANGKKM